MKFTPQTNDQALQRSLNVAMYPVVSPKGRILELD